MVLAVSNATTENGDDFRLPQANAHRPASQQIGTDSLTQCLTRPGAETDVTTGLTQAKKHSSAGVQTLARQLVQVPVLTHTMLDCLAKAVTGHK